MSGSQIALTLIFGISVVVVVIRGTVLRTQMRRNAAIRHGALAAVSSGQRA